MALKVVSFTFRLFVITTSTLPECAAMMCIPAELYAANAAQLEIGYTPNMNDKYFQIAAIVIKLNTATTLDKECSFFITYVSSID